MTINKIQSIARVECVKGNRYEGIRKGQVLPVTNMREEEHGGASFAVAGKRFFVRYAKHFSAEFNVHRGDPTKSIRFKVVATNPDV